MFPDVGHRSEMLLEAASLPPSDGLARSLLNELHLVPVPFILVLDDYHGIQQVAVHDLVAALREYSVGHQFSAFYATNQYIPDRV